MARYVTSKDRGATVAHIGYPVTACGKTFIGPHRTSATMPTDRTICRECVRRATGYGWITADEAEALLGFEPKTTDMLIPLLIEGRADREVALRLGVSVRTVHRRIAEYMHRAGARTRFERGYKLGRRASSARRAGSPASLSSLGVGPVASRSLERLLEVIGVTSGKPIKLPSARRSWRPRYAGPSRLAVSADLARSFVRYGWTGRESNPTR